MKTNTSPILYSCKKCRKDYAGPENMECPYCANERRIQAYRIDLDARMTEEARVRDEWRRIGGNPDSYNAMMKKKLEAEA